MRTGIEHFVTAAIAVVVPVAASRIAVAVMMVAATVAAVLPAVAVVPVVGYC